MKEILARSGRNFPEIERRTKGGIMLAGGAGNVWRTGAGSGRRGRIGVRAPRAGEIARACKQGRRAVSRSQALAGLDLPGARRQRPIVQRRPGLMGNAVCRVVPVLRAG